MGKGELGSWDGHVHAAILKMDQQQRPAVEHRDLCSMLCGSLDGRGARGRMDTCVWMADSLRCPPETITAFSRLYPNAFFFLKRMVLRG